MRPHILISNDDGVFAPGIQFLIDTLRPMADLLVFAPDGARSGFSTSITSAQPLSFRMIYNKPGLIVCSCSGTPVDCVKMALNLFKERPFDLVIGGINHGDNASVNAHYSGTLGVAKEAALQGYPAIAFSICDEHRSADFEPLRPYLLSMVEKVLAHPMPPFTCLNVNFPKRPSFEGVRVCRMAHCRWQREVEPYTHPRGRKIYWLVGESTNLEPEATDTDRWALDHGYVAVTPVTLDVTDYGLVDAAQDIFEE